ncbi:hypothetical protein AOQ84DRAFT_443501 [Glonium stellatum]|uniref:Uncharacterized protein n=1 Tax=Glonium stellatum TaxID=574774 RepID=A0A8E2EP07_9PEZI|nr:hypothetical protein AOQ84DRAFT_443501 [Glonium stellatum]
MGKPNPDREDLDFDGRPRSLVSLVIGSSKSLMHSYATDSFQLTDPRDRIFGLLGSSQDAEEIVIRPNYSKPTSVIFKEFTARMYKRGHLESLGHCSVREGYHYMLSWVLDWSQPSKQVTIPIRQAVTAEGDFKPASNYTSGVPVFLEKNNELEAIVLSGICIDSVEVIGPAWDANSDDLLTLARSWLATLQNLTCSHKSIYNSDDISEALWRTPIADQEQKLGYYEHITVKAADASHSSYLALCGIPESINDFGLKEWRSLKSIPYLRAMNSVSHNRKAFISSTGYLGLSPSSITSGDSICILLLAWAAHPIHSVASY